MNIKVLISLATVLLFFGLRIEAQIQNLNLSVECQNVTQNRDVCIKFKASSIQQLEAIQASITYDPTVLEIVGDPTVGACLPLFSSSNVINFGNGKISFLWFGDAVDITNCEMFSICFKFIGDPGKKAVISFANSPTEISADSPLGPVNITTQSCEIEVQPSGRATIATFCQPTVKGGSDGVIKFYGIDGVAPYTYNLINNATGASIRTGTSANKEEVTLTGIQEGNYTVSILDGSGTLFPAKTIALIDGGSNPKFDLEVINPSCFSTKNGIIRIKNLTGTFLSPKVQWSEGSFNVDTLTNLGNGKYSVSITDNNGCLVKKDTVLNKDTLRVSYTVVRQALCNNAGDNNFRGEIELKISGGTPFPNGGYRFSLGNTNNFSPPLVSPITVARIPGGMSQIQVRDNGVAPDGTSSTCLIPLMINMPYKDSISYSGIINNPVQCKGEGNGSMEVTMSGNGDYRLIREWSETLGGPVSPIGGLQSRKTYINNALKAGKYYIITESSVGQCRDTFKFTINESIIPLRVTPTVIQPSCSAFGSIRVVAAGGQPPYTYKWEDATITNTRTNLNPGNYKVTVTDFNKCDTVFNLSLVSTSTNKVAKASIATPINCYNGTGIVTVDLDTATYSWQNKQGANVGSTKLVNNLPAGTYFVTVTKDGCISQDSVTLINPTGMVFDSIQSVAPQCAKGGNKGSLGSTISGGTPGYTYEWKNVSGTVIGTQSVLTSIDAGNYSLTVKDQRGCTRDTNLSLKAPNPIAVSFVNGNMPGEVNCFGDSTGLAFVAASGGTVPNNTRFKFFWSNGLSSNANGLFDRDINTKLVGGRNWVFVGDGVCLSDTFFIDLKQKEKITLAKTIKGICGSECLGKVNLLASGGTGTLSIRFNGTQITTDSVASLCKGKYIVVITDDLSCRITDTVDISVNDSISVAINTELTQNLSCKVAKGSIAVIVNGGRPNYAYKWSNNVSSTTSQALNLDQGSYTVSVTDVNGCSNTLTYVLKAPDSIRAVIAEPKAPKCFGGGSCIEVISVSGGIGNNYTMQINNGIRIPVDSCLNLIEGKYLVSIFDADGCKNNYTVTIPGAEQLALELGDNQSISLGEEIAEIIPEISGSANSNYIYNWTGLGALTYRDSSLKNSVIGKPSDNLYITLKITDENGCSTSDNLSIEVTRARNIFIPNIFKLSSSDNTNTKFDIVAGFGVEMVEELIILDRWGNKVYQKKNYLPEEGDGWDGTHNGTALNAGVFVYAARVKFIDGEIKFYKGDITLLK
jgi:hypothetical protein